VKENGLDPETAEAEFQKISEAYTVLSDKHLRRKYDAGEDVAGDSGGGSQSKGGGDDKWEYSYDKRDVKEDGSVRATATNKKTGEKVKKDINVKQQAPEVPDPCKPRHKCIEDVVFKQNATDPNAAPPPLAPLPTSVARSSDVDNSGMIHEHINPFGLVSMHASFTLKPKPTRSEADGSEQWKPLTVHARRGEFRWGMRRDPAGRPLRLDPGRGFTVTGWIRTRSCERSSQQVGATIFSFAPAQGTYGKGSVALVLLGGALQFQLGGAGGVRSPLETLEDCRWHFVAASWAQGEVSLYVDGANAGLGSTQPIDAFPEGYVARAGYTPPGLFTAQGASGPVRVASFWEGELEGLRVFHRRLTPTAVRQEMGRLQTLARRLEPSSVVPLIQAQARFGGPNHAQGWPSRISPRNTEALRMDQDFAVSLWLKADRDGTLVSRCSPTGPWEPKAKSLFVAGGAVHFDVGWVGRLAAPQHVTDKKWHHVAVSYEEAEKRVTLYIDGKEAVSNELDAKGDPKGSVLHVGWTCPGLLKPTSSWGGELDRVSYLASYLTPSDAHQLHAAGVEAKPGATGTAAGTSGTTVPLLYHGAGHTARDRESNPVIRLAREFRAPERLGNLADDWSLGVWSHATRGVLWSHRGERSQTSLLITIYGRITLDSTPLQVQTSLHKTRACRCKPACRGTRGQGARGRRVRRGYRAG